MPTTQLVFLIVSVGSRGGPDGRRSTGGDELGRLVGFVARGGREDGAAEGAGGEEAGAEEGGVAPAGGAAAGEPPQPPETATRATVAAQIAILRIIRTPPEAEPIGRARDRTRSPKRAGARGATPRAPA
ncbi:hypothetical protein Ari01nite_57170 [Paractinoplanes rishiriensis]|uniref:Uncharacterized protein n=1 Tax=Paractinoplanes rishiriensis TaxID=1050105 RepID=A0A919K2W7_9ACTN|nr:hypothetical protein Ari01nite_57170 [Actinoplanes rishiriensis]